MTTTIDRETGEVQHGSERYPVPSEYAFVEDGEAVEYQTAGDLADLADELIAREDLHLSHLEERPIAYLWRAKGGTSKGNPILGKCQKPAGLLKHFSGQDFVVWLAADHCRTFAFTRQQIEALLFSQLCAAWVDEAGEPVVLAPDFTGFRAEVEHYGFWRLDLQQAADTFQTRMDLDGGA